MKKNLKLKFQKGDILAIILVAALAIGVSAAFLPLSENTDQAMVQIWQDGRLVWELPLDEDRIFEISGEYHNVVCIQDGQVCIMESDCPGKDCVHSGAVSTVGRSIICLPNRVEIRITGVQDEVDFVVG